MYFYAQLNDSGICISVTQTAGPMEGPNFVPIDGIDPSLIGRHWNGTGWDD